MDAQYNNIYYIMKKPLGVIKDITAEFASISWPSLRASVMKRYIWWVSALSISCCNPMISHVDGIMVFVIQIFGL